VGRRATPWLRASSGFDAAEVQHLVDQLQQVLRPAQDLLRIGLLVRRQGGLAVALQQLREAEDGVHRRAQLVRHVAEEL
jgi:hypothetical protein